MGLLVGWLTALTLVAQLVLMAFGASVAYMLRRTPLFKLLVMVYPQLEPLSMSPAFLVRLTLDESYRQVLPVWSTTKSMLRWVPRFVRKWRTGTE